MCSPALMGCLMPGTLYSHNNLLLQHLRICRTCTSHARLLAPILHMRGIADPQERAVEDDGSHSDTCLSIFTWLGNLPCACCCR